MYNLICADKYYSVYTKRQMKKEKIKKSCIIAIHKSKFNLQQIADNLNKKIPKVNLTILATSDSSRTINSNSMLNIGTSNVIFENEEGICVLSSYNCDIVQCNTKSDSNLTNNGNTNDKDNIKYSAYITESVLCINENPNTLIVSNNEEMNNSSPTANSNATLNIDISNMIFENEGGICVPSSCNCDIVQYNTKSDSNLLKKNM